MFNPMQTAKKLASQRNQTRTTVIKIDKYVINKEDPAKSVIIGQDMFDKDENGIPKKVEVRHANEKTNGVADFANPGTLMHTEVGGLVRLSQFRVGGSGEYITNHMQRIAKNDGPKVAGNLDKFDISFMKGWTKIYPKKDRDGSLTVFERNKKLFHKADALVIPEDTQVTTMNFGSDTFESELETALNRAIDLAPAGTQPMIMVRMKGQLQADEIRLPNFRVDADKNIIPLTKEETIVAAKERGKLANNYLPAHQQAKDAGETGQAEFVAGFALNAIGLKWDGKSMTKDSQTGEDIRAFNERSLIEDFISETAQRHRLPKQEGEERARYAVDDGSPQYSFGILSYRKKQVEEGQFAQADLDTFGRDHGVQMRVSPNAGLDEKPNPYQPTQTAAQAAASVPGEAGQAARTAQSEQANQPSQQAAQTTTTAPEQRAPEAKPNAAQPAPTPEPEKVETVEEPVDDQQDFGIDDFAEDHFDVDMDDIEQQLAGQNL